MDKLYELVKESTIGQITLGLMFGGTVCYMWAHGQEVPDALVGLLGTIIGFYFGGKAVVAAQRLPS